MVRLAEEARHRQSAKLRRSMANRCASGVLLGCYSFAHWSDHTINIASLPQSHSPSTIETLISVHHFCVKYVLLQV
jgi:hypothetical protein